MPGSNTPWDGGPVQVLPKCIDSEGDVIKDPFIFKVLDISTGHMTLEDSKKLGPETKQPVYELDEYGWLVYVGEMSENWDETMSEAFMNILKAAKELGCDYVRFDRDGRMYVDLPYFDW